MTVLLDASVERTLDTLIARLEASHRGARVEAWLFEDEAERRAAERRLAAAGVAATLRSAYKPLVHVFLEEVERTGLTRVCVRYPVRPEAAPQRFLLEAYPLHALLDGVELTFVAGGADLSYTVTLGYADGRSVERRVFAPNVVRTDHVGKQVLHPCGWLRVTPVGMELPVIDEPVETEFETIFHRAVDAVCRHPWGREEPYFEALEIAVTIPGIERPLPYFDECMSTREALHEDLYFSLLEFFQRHSGRPLGDRGLQPGQIVPEVRAGAAPRLRVAIRPFDGRGEHPEPAVPLETAGTPLSFRQIEDELAALGGEPFEARSREGRAVRGTHVAGSDPGVVITAGQHANETTGVVGALRAARRLRAEPNAHFALIPLENPDGYALHRHLRRDNPRHMHHAARYTALGDDLEYREKEPLFERAARLEALRRTGATLHINLHGYPAHEWTRPLSGYLPRGFELWSIPKGFFLIMRHHPGLGAQARDFIVRLTGRLAQDERLVAYNRAQLATYRVHAGEVPFAVYNDIPCLIAENERQIFPFTLITEHPDETVYGDAFHLGHEAQMNTVLAAVELHMAGAMAA
ncbi:M14 family zinc carboxypeptidase [Chelatococcus sp. SYSU_G07232]|uniref:M14 family zinc carboxypeptidase n=1 Tax=Chelatococcus albus TaxID=3047466 RepID=A0ABT7ABB7_9HYPH|nr:M14 family zinc carboxypeptidase [Chelatococcus sp. SYSU_G07232]MDJ1156658.1 M14 family zinc carboxypeptidase [Chelatococcus sp. SYSU_G07232]